MVNINILIGIYTLSQTYQTPQHVHPEAQEVATRDDAFRNRELAVNAAMLCLHQSYQFVQTASQLRYTYPSWKEYGPIMCKAQSDAVVQCCFVLDGLAALATRLQTEYSSAASTLGESETLAGIYASRTRLMWAIISILCVHSPYETDYDVLRTGFEAS